MTISFRWPETWVKRVTSSIPPTTNTKWRASLLFTWDGDIQSFFFGVTLRIFSSHVWLKQVIKRHSLHAIYYMMDCIRK